MKALSNEEKWISQRPVLLVGVGGTGCRVAEKIRQTALENQSELSRRLAILGVDTDTGDVDKMRSKHMEMVQLSSHSRVEEILTDGGLNDYLKWHPSASELTWKYLNRDMLTGAGQIRLLSRLAFTENLTTRRSIDSALKKIQIKLFSPSNTLDHPAATGSVDVMVICSLAGGTGSGMFLPLSIYIRNWLESLKLTTYFKGFFLLPGIYKNSSQVPPDQHPNLDTNAYASLKELHSLVQSVTGRHSMPVDFSISKKISAHLAHANDLPFDLVSMFDDSSRGGQALGRNIGVYESMAADCAHQLLLTPIGVNSQSTMDNNILNYIAAERENRTEIYMSMGTSGICYPQDSVEKYLGLRYTLATMDDEWLLPEERYRNEIREHEMQKAAGNSKIKRPKRFQSYIQSVESMATQEEGRGFFSGIKALVERMDDNEEGRATRTYDAFLAAITSEVLKSFRDDDSLRDLYSPTFGVQSKDVFKRNLLKNVNTREMLFSALESAIEERLLSEPRNTIASLWTIGEQSSDEGWKPHHLQYHLLRNKLHPVASRYFLYNLKIALADSLREELKAKASYERTLENLRREFDDPETQDTIETPVSRARDVGATGFWKELIARQKTRFVDDYLAYCDNRTNTLRKSADSAVKVKLYEVLIYHVNALISVYEELFAALEDLKDQLLEETEAEANAYSSALQERDTYIYVAGGKKAKEAMWDELRLHIEDEERAKDVYRSLGETLYGVYKERTEERGRFDQIVITDFKELFQEKVRRDFCQAVVREKYAGYYQMCAVNAAKFDARLEQVSKPAEHLRDLVRLVLQQSNPLVMLEGQDMPRRIWAVSGVNLEALDGTSGAESVLVGGDHNATILANNQFSDTRLSCATFAMRLEASDFSKFALHGEYQVSYQARIDELLQQQFDRPGEATGVFTPHISKDWHKPGMLPEITREIERKRNEQALQAFFLGYAQELFQTRKVNRQERIFFKGRNICPANETALLFALIANPPAVRSILDSSRSVSGSTPVDALATSRNVLKAALIDIGSENKVNSALDTLFALVYGSLVELNPRMTGEGLKNLFVDQLKYKSSLARLKDFTCLEVRVRETVKARIDAALSQFIGGLEQTIAARSEQGKL